MSGAPASVHQATRRGVVLIVEREYQPDPARCVAAIVKLLTYCSSGQHATATDTAGSVRPPGTGDRPTTTHEDRVHALGKRDAAFEEDGRHEPTDI